MRLVIILADQTPRPSRVEKETGERERVREVISVISGLPQPPKTAKISENND
jgi:hypothetical protein